MFPNLQILLLFNSDTRAYIIYYKKEVKYLQNWNKSIIFATDSHINKLNNLDYERAKRNKNRKESAGSICR